MKSGQEEAYTLRQEYLMQQWLNHDKLGDIKASLSIKSMIKSKQKAQCYKIYHSYTSAVKAHRINYIISLPKHDNTREVITDQKMMYEKLRQQTIQHFS